MLITKFKTKIIIVSVLRIICINKRNKTQNNPATIAWLFSARPRRRRFRTPRLCSGQWHFG